MVIEPILKGLLLGLILSISIGPVIFAIIKQSLTNGKRSGYAFVAGVSSSDFVLLFILTKNLGLKGAFLSIIVIEFFIIVLYTKIIMKHLREKTV